LVINIVLSGLETQVAVVTQVGAWYNVCAVTKEVPGDELGKIPWNGDLMVI
jgi:hypothetical protein